MKWYIVVNSKLEPGQGPSKRWENLPILLKSVSQLALGSYLNNLLVTFIAGDNLYTHQGSHVYPLLETLKNWFK